MNIKKIPKYIISYGGGKIVQTSYITNQDKLDCNNGQSTIINTTDFTHFVYGDWVRIRSYDY